MRVSPINNYNYINRQQTQKSNSVNYNKPITSNPAFGYKYPCPYSFGETYSAIYRKMICGKDYFSSVYPALTNAVTHLLYGVRFIPCVELSPLMSKICPLSELKDYDDANLNSFLSIDKIFDRIRNQRLLSGTKELTLARDNNGKKLIDCYSYDGSIVDLTFYPREETQVAQGHKFIITGTLTKANEQGKRGYEFELMDMCDPSIISYEFWPTNLEGHPSANIKQYLHADGSRSDSEYFREDGSPREFRNLLNEFFGI